jgi:hypothetical protein
MRRTLFYFLPLILFHPSNLTAQVLVRDTCYQAAYEELSQLLSHDETKCFKKTVFITENAFLRGTLSYNDFENAIDNLLPFVRCWMKTNSIRDYSEEDSIFVRQTGAIFALMRDTIQIRFADNIVKKHYPYNYDFNDFEGTTDWTNTFVTKLLVSGSGNCHSLPYLYKILADELNVSNVWLAFAPNHIYIKNYCKKIGWYNTELTSGEFPVDAWIMASGYISPDAVRSGIYMDTLSNQEVVANCALDLAKGYERKYNIYSDSFIVKCCDLTLKYQPNNINAIIYKAETLKKMYQVYKNKNSILASAIYPEMEKLYFQALDLGYKEMPERMYKEWLLAIRKQKQKYSN